VARRLARELVREGFGVVSGLAHGIDAAAHRGALEEGGATVAVLGCGPDRVYPADHEALADEIAHGGAVMSELPPGARPLPHHFPLRNRLIGALGRAVVVVEANARSGSLITAEHAAEQGREVLAVPGPLDAATSDGPNLLLRDGARPVLDASDVLAAIAPFELRPRAPAATMPPDAAELAERLREEPATRDELATRLGLSPQELARRLLPLELDGRVREGDDGRLRVLPF
jgi:DNA processing protein